MFQENPQWRQKSRIIYVNNTRLLVSYVCVLYIISKFFLFVAPYIFDYHRFSILSASLPYIIPQNKEYAVFQRLVSFHLIL